MVSVPKNPFSQQKFNEALARILGTARRTLFTDTNIQVSRVATDYHFYTRSFSSRLFQAPGDTIFLTFAGKVGTTGGTPQIGFRLFGNSSGSGYSWLLEESGGKAFNIAANSNFYGICSATLVDRAGTVVGNGMIFNDNSASPPYVSRSSSTVIGEQLTLSGLYTSLPFAGDTTFDFIKVEFSPGLGIVN